MGTGYTRNDTPNNIADGNVINAADLDGEFDAIVAAFNSSTGHSHDGTTGEGPQITSSGLAANAVTATAIAANSIALGTKTTGSYVEQGATSGNGLSGSVNAESGTFTVTSNATDANTASTIVFRDASGDFSAGTVTAALTGNVTGNVTGDVTGNVTGDVTGNADTATTLATGRTIGMTGDVVWTSASFDGSGNVTGTATIQANSVALGTDTTGDYTSDITAGTGLASTGATSGEGISHTLSLDLNELTTSVSDGDGDFFAVVDSLGNQKKLTKANIALSGFDNDITGSFITDVASDTTPQLGGNLDLNSNDITGTGNISITGSVTSDGFVGGDSDKIQLGAGTDLEIYHDGTDSIIDNVTSEGSIKIQDTSSTVVEIDAAGVTVTGRALSFDGTNAITTDSPSSNVITFDLTDNTNFQATTTGDDELTFSNTVAGQSGNIFLTTGGGTISANAMVAINADALTALSTAGVYHLAYFVKAATGDNRVLVSVSGALT